jgi:hypothetical protein
MAQFGIAGDPAVTAKWTDANLQDDPVKQQNTRGRINFRPVPTHGRRNYSLITR